MIANHWFEGGGPLLAWDDAPLRVSNETKKWIVPNTFRDSRFSQFFWMNHDPFWGSMFRQETQINKSPIYIKQVFYGKEKENHHRLICFVFFFWMEGNQNHATFHPCWTINSTSTHRFIQLRLAMYRAAPDATTQLEYNWSSSRTCVENVLHWTKEMKKISLDLESVHNRYKYIWYNLICIWYMWYVWCICIYSHILYILVVSQPDQKQLEKDLSLKDKKLRTNVICSVQSSSSWRSQNGLKHKRNGKNITKSFTETWKPERNKTKTIKPKNQPKTFISTHNPPAIVLVCGSSFRTKKWNRNKNPHRISPPLPFQPNRSAHTFTLKAPSLHL